MDYNKLQKTATKEQRKFIKYDELNFAFWVYATNDITSHVFNQ